MRSKENLRTRMGALDTRMFVVKDFIDEFYNKTLFQSGKVVNPELTPSEIKSIFAFEEEDKEYPIGKLGKNAQVKRSAITNMIDCLEKEGIAERVRDGEDRRVVKVRLTGKGRKIRREFIQRRRKEVEKIFSKLSEKDKDSLLHHLEEAYHILQKI
ncbi:MAG: MarR family transcriptional regulator [Deltaproteobacteria bacterium]|nr:MarR family transcriptional regulator [Deltaproteobacteria bacterium]